MEEVEPRRRGAAVGCLMGGEGSNPAVGEVLEVELRRWGVLEVSVFGGCPPYYVQGSVQTEQKLVWLSCGSVQG